jgi:hypothetical protein
MDLVTAARQVIIAMRHAAEGKRKIVNACTPLTGRSIVLSANNRYEFAGGGATLLETSPRTIAKSKQLCHRCHFTRALCRASYLSIGGGGTLS